MHSHFWLHLFDFSPLCVFKVTTVLFGECAQCTLQSQQLRDFAPTFAQITNWFVKFGRTHLHSKSCNRNYSFMLFFLFSSADICLKFRSLFVNNLVTILSKSKAWNRNCSFMICLLLVRLQFLNYWKNLVTICNRNCSFMICLLFSYVCNLSLFAAFSLW